MDIMYAKAAAFIGAAFVMGFGSFGPALGQGLIGMKACENIGKYPDSSADIRLIALMALAFVEASAVYCLLIALILIFTGRTLV